MLPINVAATEQTYNEHRLLQELQQGRSQAFLELYNIYHPALYHYVLRFVKSPAIAEDILQDVFLKIWEIRERINPDLSFKAYLYRISRNSVFKLMKKIAVDENLRLQVMQQFRQTVSDADLKVSWQQYEAILQAAIANLSPQRQKVFLLCREEGKTYEQVAAELNISRHTVKEHMVLAMKSIKEYFEQYGNTPLSFTLLLFLSTDVPL
ncbi:RNA polymerase sigma-70 factor [Pseudoflavitalea sp. X16]|uniref:RNA polymerase sigma factor n=1 Tax=Paraflavitalea devenefica TaxID=2716334 RepID=UPI001423FE07|nr:RNA polymerase sigma-70 factor [Paraflavitalea devenefica]NII27010.1 RNA polymerase sigma-70 factor [Paraflavitalea devenefica]